VCDLETSRMGAPYIYIYDISRLRVNNLTLLLLTWRKRTPNNASKWQMGFNSAFKGLTSKNNNREQYYCILVNNQLEAKFFFRVYLFQFSRCFEHHCAHHQENQLY